jgi:hypothetical protein
MYDAGTVALFVVLAFAAGLGVGAWLGVGVVE